MDRKIGLFFISFCILFLQKTVAQSADWQSKIDPTVWESLDKQEKVDFFVLMKEQANTETPSSYTKQEKANYVFGQLELTAKRSQTKVLEILKTGNHPHQAFWVANAIKAKGKFELIEELAKLAEVARILPNQAIQHHVPVRDPALDIYNGGGISKSGEGDIEWGILQIRANLLWEQGIRGNGVVIGGQDTGYDWEHTALVGKYRGSQNADTSHHYNWHDAIHEPHELNSDANNPCGFDVNYPCDDGSHGTHTMGTMVGLYDQTGTGTGKISYIGVAPDAQWVGCRNMERGWGTPATYMECFQWFLG
ncbi:MAG: S8 family serine peptidase, partial [Saprospiraceae bacterium]|nr:S8 family serine peptidase [Saprospiraceae bacterium]